MGGSVTRRIDIFDPVVITIAKIDGGSTNNVIPEAATCHSNKMVFNEAMLARGVAAHCAIAERFLAHGFD